MKTGDEAFGEHAFVSKRPEQSFGSSGGAVAPRGTPTAVGTVERVNRIEWYVVETQRHREPVARAVLAERGITTYLPRVEQWPRPSVGGAIAPMFPGYLFVQIAFDEQGHRVVRANGVKAFVAFGGEPVPVGPEAIDFLRSREGPDGLVRCGAVGGDGAAVRIVEGPFRGLTAVVTERLGAHDRVRVLMEILQRQTAVELPARWLRRL